MAEQPFTAVLGEEGEEGEEGEGSNYRHLWVQGGSTKKCSMEGAQ